MSLTKVSYSMIQGSPVNVLDFGADASGATDSTTAIQDAIDAVQAAGGGVVLLPVGTYVVTQLDVSSTTGVSIVGQSAVIKQKDASVGSSLVNFRGTLFGTSVSKFLLQGIEFDGNKSGNGGTTNISTYRQSCVYLSGNNITVQNCITHDATDSGIVVLGGTRNYVLNNVSHNNFLLGFRIGSFPALPITHSVISGNTAYDNCIPDNDYTSTFTTLTPDGYIIENTSYTRISDCDAYYTGVHSDLSQSGSGFKFFECQYNAVSNITAHNCPWQGVHVERSSFNTFTSGISTANGMTFAGTASNGTGNGLYVLNSDDNSFSDFVCNDNTYKDAFGGNGVQVLSSGVLTTKRNIFLRVSAQTNNRNGFQVFQDTDNSDNNFLSCHSVDNGAQGFEIRANRTTIDSCIVENETIGVYLRHDNLSVQTTDHSVTNNKFYDNTTALQTETINPVDLNTTVKNNTFNGNTANYVGFSNLAGNIAIDAGYATQVFNQVANASVVTYPIQNQRGLLFVQTSQGEYIIASCNFSSLSQIAVSTNGVVDATNGTLTGTTGTVGKITIRVNNGLLYIENRVASGAKIALTVLS